MNERKIINVNFKHESVANVAAIEFQHEIFDAIEKASNCNVHQVVIVAVLQAYLHSETQEMIG